MSEEPEESTKHDEDETWKSADFLSLENGNNDDEDEAEIEEGDSAQQNGQAPPPPPCEELPPWMEQLPATVDARRINPLVALHNEIVDFCALMTPLPEEIKEREQLVESFKEVAYDTFGSDKVR